MSMILTFTTQLGQKKECLCKHQCYCILVYLATFFVRLFLWQLKLITMSEKVFFYFVSCNNSNSFSFVLPFTYFKLFVQLYQLSYQLPLKVFGVLYVAKITWSCCLSCHVLPLRNKIIINPPTIVNCDIFYMTLHT